MQFNINEIICQYEYFDKSLNSMDRLQLFHDGSMTRFLELKYCEQIQTKVLLEDQIQQNYIYDWRSLLQDAQIHREVLLSTQNCGNIIYARSVWNKQNYEYIMGQNKIQAIGNNMKKNLLSQRREILLACKIKLQLDQINFNKEVLARAYIVYEQNNLLFYMEEYFLQ